MINRLAITIRGLGQCMERLMDLAIATEKRFVAGRMSRTCHDDMLKSIGFAPNELGLLADKDLNLNMAEVSTVDWVHSALQDGSLVVEMQLLIKTLEEHGLCSYAQLEAWLRNGWGFPNAYAIKSQGAQSNLLRDSLGRLARRPTLFCRMA